MAKHQVAQLQASIFSGGDDSSNMLRGRKLSGSNVDLDEYGLVKNDNKTTDEPMKRSNNH